MKVTYIKERVVLNNTPTTPDIGYVKQYQKTNGLWYDLDSLGVERVLNWELLNPIIINQPQITVYNEALANTITNVLTTNITLPFDGDYMFDLSFNWNANANSQNVRFYSTLNNLPLDLNDRSGDPQGNTMIFQGRVDNASNTASGAISGTGSGMKLDFTKKFILLNQVAGTYPFVLQQAGQTANVSVSIWNIVGEFKLINLI